MHALPEKHVDVDPASISRNIAVDIPIVADAREAIRALGTRAEPLDTEVWRAQIAAWDSSHPLLIQADGLTPQRILQEINTLYDHAVIATDVGQNQLWATQFLELDEQRQLLTSGGLGTMGS